MSITPVGQQPNPTPQQLSTALREARATARRKSHTVDK